MAPIQSQTHVGNWQIHNSKAHFENIGILLQANFLAVNNAYSQQESERCKMGTSPENQKEAFEVFVWRTCQTGGRSTRRARTPHEDIRARHKCRHGRDEAPMARDQSQKYFETCIYRYGSSQKDHINFLEDGLSHHKNSEAD
jgi:hypothetical protein